MPSISNVISPGKKERVLSSSRKQRCLFNTMHVKTAMALTTVFYLFGLAIIDHNLFWEDMDYLETMFLCIISIVVIFVIVLAQFGLNFEKYKLLIPFFIVQALFLGAIYIFYSRAITGQLIYGKLHPQTIMRLLLIIMYELIMAIMHTYALLITVRCIVYFKNKKQRGIDRLCFTNRCFLENIPNAKSLKDRIVNLKIDVTTDEEDAQSMNTALGTDYFTQTFASAFGSGGGTESAIHPAPAKPPRNATPAVNSAARSHYGVAELTETPRSALRLPNGIGES